MKLTQFYEVMDSEYDIIWGGESAYEAVEWFRRTADGKVQVSVWNTESEDDYRLVDSPIDVTPIIRATFLCQPFNPKDPGERKLRVVK